MNVKKWHQPVGLAYAPAWRVGVCIASAVWLGVTTLTASAQTRQITIWDGVFSDTQAARGQQGYKQACARCHREDLLGDAGAPPLVGEMFLSRFDGSTADRMVKAIRASMPQEAPNSLGTEAYVDIVSYLLQANGSPSGASELSTDSEMLLQIQVTSRETRR